MRDGVTARNERAAALWQRLAAGEMDLFALVYACLAERQAASEDERPGWQTEIDRAYRMLHEEIATGGWPPSQPVSFGTSGWRGILGRDLNVRTVTLVTRAIVSLYLDLDRPGALDASARQALGVDSLAEARRRGVVVGHDNRFGNPLMAVAVVDELTANGFFVHLAGESTTGALSAAVLEEGAAFSVNLTPSHNPLEYGGYKYNPADAGPAPPELTRLVTERARRLMAAAAGGDGPAPRPELVRPCDALSSWRQLVERGAARHGLVLQRIVQDFAGRSDLVLAVDCIHGASRGLIRPLLSAAGRVPAGLVLLRDAADHCFGGVAPEPSTANMAAVTDLLAHRTEALKLGVIIDPDGDRIRFTDGTDEIGMNQFGAMAYYYLHECKGKSGPVAKTVATSNFANAVAAGLGEEVFEPAVGFKNFRPVLDRALVCFEESDGMTVLGHTPEKDALIGLVLALDMVMTLGKNLGDLKRELEARFGAFYPDRTGLVVAAVGVELAKRLEGLDRYVAGGVVVVGGRGRSIGEIITVDGLKMVFTDGAWLMIRPSGTEPKVRVYVEGRSPEDRDALFAAARQMLVAMGL